MKADLNVIDFDRLRVRVPRDRARPARRRGPLPTRRADGYLATVVSGGGGLSGGRCPPGPSRADSSGAAEPQAFRLPRRLRRGPGDAPSRIGSVRAKAWKTTRLTRHVPARDGERGVVGAPCARAGRPWRTRRRCFRRTPDAASSPKRMSPCSGQQLRGDGGEGGQDDPDARKAREDQRHGSPRGSAPASSRPGSRPPARRPQKTILLRKARLSSPRWMQRSAYAPARMLISERPTQGAMARSPASAMLVSNVSTK